MKRLFVFSILALIAVLAAGTLFAEDVEPGVRIDTGFGVSASIYESFITVTPKAVYDFGLAALGGGVKTYFGLDFADIYIAPFVAAELGWFYLYFGLDIMVKAPDEAASETGFAVPAYDENLLPFASLGMAPPLFSVGPGKLGLDFSVDFIATASPVEVTDDTGSFIGDAIGTIFSTITGFVFNLIKIGASLFYTISL